MLGAALSWLAGGGIAAIGGEIRKARKDVLDARNTSERIDADKVLAGLEARRSVLIAEAGDIVNRAMRASFALPFALYNFKLIVYDKMAGLGATDPLSPELTQTMWIVLGFYFLSETSAMWRKK